MPCSNIPVILRALRQYTPLWIAYRSNRAVVTYNKLPVVVVAAPLFGAFKRCSVSARQSWRRMGFENICWNFNFPSQARYHPPVIPYSQNPLSLWVASERHNSGACNFCCWMAGTLFLAYSARDGSKWDIRRLKYLLDVSWLCWENSSQEENGQWHDYVIRLVLEIEDTFEICQCNALPKKREEKNAFLISPKAVHLQVVKLSQHNGNC